MGPPGQKLNPALMYSMRSVLANGSATRLIVSGECPEHLDPGRIEYVTERKPHGLNARLDSRANLRRVVTDPDCPEAFVICHDDTFLLRPPGFPFPEESKGPLRADVDARVGRCPTSLYTRAHEHTLEFLRGLGIADPACYSLHRPEMVLRDLLREVLDLVGEDSLLLPRTVYGALAARDGVRPGEYVRRDSKVYGRLEAFDVSDWTVSTCDESWPGLAGAHVRALYPDPAPWEVPLPQRYARRAAREARRYVELQSGA